ncbi:hypothetical protein Bco22_009960 [Bartonella sp. Coyote22sub2]|nr:hypothetical protein Bho114_001440 [Bartonella sp. 114]AQX25669.1 hypothetical protein Bco22_009960 [Bartonella sp. Coyote22sub2]
MYAYIYAISSNFAKRPAAPAWPVSILIRNKTALSSVFKSRNFATHFAGSQYVTRGSVNPAIARIGGYC